MKLLTSAAVSFLLFSLASVSYSQIPQISKARLQKLVFCCAVLPYLFLVDFARAADIYDPVTGFLTIPKVQIRDSSSIGEPLLYDNVVITIKDVVSAGGSYPLPSGVITGETDTYNLENGQLSIPQVVLADTVYEDIVVTINSVISQTSWGVPTSAAPVVFPASDVSQETIDLTLNWYNIASTEWGNFGPVEIYIVGESLAAASALEDRFCERHIALDSKWEEEWDCANENYRIFTIYVEEGGAAISDFKRVNRDYDFLMMIVSAKYPSPDEEDYKPVILHEYFHIFQHSQIKEECPDYPLPCERENKMGGKDKPWFAEGGAEYMAQRLYSEQEGVRNGYLREVMRRKLDSVSYYRAQDVPLDQLTYSSDVGTSDIGSWFIAYLIYNEGMETFRDGFYDDLSNMSFDAAFESNFRTTRAQYLEDFDIFLDRPVDEIMSIIVE
jgi:hypothetical protein